MGIKIKNLQTGEFEKFNIPALKGEKGEPGEIEPSEKVDYIGKQHSKLRDTMNANVDYIIKTAIGEFNYLDYEGQHITATNSIEGHAKSAILKGQTLVNLWGTKKEHFFINNGTFENSVLTSNGWCCLHRVEFFKPNTEYTLITNIISISDTNTYFKANNVASNGIFKTETNKLNKVGIYVEKVVSYDDFTGREYSARSLVSGGGTIQFNMVVLEGDYTNVDIPYFEGMQSVKMPVLTTTGKNLFDFESFKEEKNRVNTGGAYSSFELKLKPNTKYAFNRFTSDGYNSTCYMLFNTVQGSYIGSLGWLVHSDNANINSQQGQFTTGDTGIVYVSGLFNTDNLNKSFELIQNLIIVEGGTIPTSYEPYKSNILTVNEPVELRGIGDVQDELDCLTGEVISNFDEMILTGEERVSNWATSGSFFVKTNRTNQLQNNNIVLCVSDKIPSANVNDIYRDTVGIGSMDGNFVVRLPQLTTSDEVSNWLKQNAPIKVLYATKQATIKTVDLSDNHVYSYKGTTHYDCSSAEGSLVPTLSVKVPTDVQATIAQQRETIQTLNSENERLNQIQEALKASMLDSQVQLMNLSWDTDFEVFTLRESIAPKDYPMVLKTGSNIDKFSQAKFIIENDCPDLEKLNSQIEYYFSKDVFSQEQFEELTDLISIVKGGNGCEY